MRRIFKVVLLILQAGVYSCEENSSQITNVNSDNSVKNETEIAKLHSSWQDSTLGNTTIKSLTEAGFTVEPSIYKVAFNTYRKFKNDSIELRVVSSINNKGHGEIDSLALNYKDEHYQFKRLNYFLFSPLELVSIKDNKGVNIRLQDFNFDIFPDVAIYNRETSGVKNIMEDIYIFDKKRQRYFRNKTLSANSNVSIDTTGHTLSTFGQGGMASMIYGSTTYAWDESKLKPIRTVDQTYSDSLNVFVRKIRNLQDTLWITTIDTLTEENAKEWK